MALGLSLVLLALGAILTFAVQWSFRGIDISAAGIILMAVGGIGLLMSLLFWSSFAPFATHNDHVDVHRL